MNDKSNDTFGTDDVTNMKKEAQSERRNGVIGGLFLIMLGGLFLLTQFITFDVAGWLFLPLLATVFIVWGVLTRNAGLLIPGGILSGIGLGVGLMELPAVVQSGVDEGGIFLLGFAAGWVLITVLSALFTAETHWWALIPASIMGLIGFGVMTDGILLDVLSVVGRGWPLILIAVGLYIIIRPQKFQEWFADEDDKPEVAKH